MDLELSRHDTGKGQEAERTKKIVQSCILSNNCLLVDRPLSKGIRSGSTSLLDYYMLRPHIELFDCVLNAKVSCTVIIFTTHCTASAWPTKGVDTQDYTLVL